jgi:hypothetical protein
LKVTSKAFGMGRRMPIAAKYEQEKNRRQEAGSAESKKM